MRAVQWACTVGTVIGCRVFGRHPDWSVHGKNTKINEKNQHKLFLQSKSSAANFKSTYTTLRKKKYLEEDRSTRRKLFFFSDLINFPFNELKIDINRIIFFDSGNHSFERCFIQKTLSEIQNKIWIRRREPSFQPGTIRVFVESGLDLAFRRIRRRLLRDTGSALPNDVVEWMVTV